MLRCLIRLWREAAVQVLSRALRSCISDTLYGGALRVDGVFVDPGTIGFSGATDISWLRQSGLILPGIIACLSGHPCTCLGSTKYPSSFQYFRWPRTPCDLVGLVPSVSAPHHTSVLGRQWYDLGTSRHISHSQARLVLWDFCDSSDLKDPSCHSYLFISLFNILVSVPSSIAYR